MPVLINPYRFGAVGGGAGGSVSEPWEVVGSTTTVASGKISLGGFDFSGLIAVRVIGSGIVATTDDSTLSLRFHISGSESSSNYGWIVRPIQEGTSSFGTDSAASGASAMGITSVTATRGVGNASTEAAGFTMTVFAPGSTDFHKLVMGQVNHVLPAPATSRTVFGGIATDTGAVTGFTLLGSSDIVSGKLILLGLS